MGKNGYRVQLLAPPQAAPLASGTPVILNRQLYQRHFISMQRLRARCYLEDGAIESWQVDSHGRFWMEGDDISWHFLLVDEQEEAIACLRLLLHARTAGFDQLRIAHASIANDPLWGGKLRAAINSDLRKARTLGIGYAEIGGWAIAANYRCTKAALETLVASYAWGQLVGGCLTSCTATVRHRSAMILRRLGGESLAADGEPIPPYNDPQYGCEMEVLRFDSRVIDARFMKMVNEMRQKLEGSTVLRAALSEVEEINKPIPLGQQLLALA